VRVRRDSPIGFLASVPMIRLVGDDPMREAIDELARRLGVSKELGVQVQTSRLALELVRRGMGWTVVDFLTAGNLDASAMTAVELPQLPAIPLYLYHASASPPGQQAARMLQLLEAQLALAMSRQSTPA
jgi:hypothetical protein